MGRRAAPAVTALLGLLALVIAVAVAGAATRTHLQGTNNIRPFGYIVTITPGKTTCQSGENVPGGAGGVRVLAGTAGRPGPRIALRVEPAGSPPVRGVLAAGWREGYVTIPVPEVRGDRTGVRVCLTNEGADQVTLAGEPFGGDLAARIGTAPEPGRARIEYMRPHPESWWSLAPSLPARLAAVRAALPGAATGYLWALLALAVAGGAVALVLREARE